MEWNLVKCLMLCVIVLVQIEGHRCCFEEERTSLLRFKASLKSPGVNLLPSWVDEKESDCCGWEGVTCNTTSSHIIYLSLQKIVPEYGPILLLNVSFFQTFKELRSLDLSNNMFRGLLENEGLCALKKLEELDLSQNYFEGILPPCVNNLTSLRLIDLSQNSFTGNFSSSLISALTSLEYIDLSQNRFKGLFSLNSFANHAKLEVVAITSDINEFEVAATEISDWVPMFQLKVLVLSNCKLNKLTGNIPKFLLNQQELREVDLSHNNLKGKFPNWLLQNNTRLEFLNLRNNFFTGQFHLPPHPNNNKFWIDFSDNQVGGQLPENMGQMVPYILHLNLSRNTFEGSMPTSICDMKYLMELDLSFNNFSGEVPKQLITGCVPYLEVLKLSNNNFHGQIFSENSSLTVRRLHLDNNQFTGTLSIAFPNFGFLFVLDVSNNFMSGEIQYLQNDRRIPLYALILRNNSFKGMFPCELVPSVILDLSHNSFSGSLLSCSSLKYLKHIYLRSNKFTGSIPKVLLNSSSLLTMDLGDNFLSDSIPDLISGLSNIRILALGGNNLSGLIPNQLCHLNKISLMDLSKNSFSGSIPYCFNNISFGKINGYSDDVFVSAFASVNVSPTFYTYGSHRKKEFSIQHIKAEYLRQDEIEFVTKNLLLTYKGDILNYMSGLDLSCNKLTGEIPHELGNLSSIHALNLSHNQITGPIPTSFSKLAQVESLDLSYNNLSGKIPSNLIDLYSLAVFTVAHNNLSGKVPDRKAQFGTFENSSYDGNPFLCGQPLDKSCTTVVKSPQSSSNESKRKWYEIDLVAFYASFAASYVVFLLGVASVLYINHNWRRQWFNLLEACYYSIYDAFFKFLACFHN